MLGGEQLIDEFFNASSPDHLGQWVDRYTSASSIDYLIDYCGESERCVSRSIVKWVMEPLEQRLGQLVQRVEPKLELKVQEKLRGGDLTTALWGMGKGLVLTTGIYTTCVAVTMPTVTSLWSALLAWWYGTTAATTLGAAMWAGPVGWVVAGGAILGGYWAYSSYEEERQINRLRFRDELKSALFSQRIVVKRQWREAIERLQASYKRGAR